MAKHKEPKKPTIRKAKLTVTREYSFELEVTQKQYDTIRKTKLDSIILITDESGWNANIDNETMELLRPIFDEDRNIEPTSTIIELYNIVAPKKPKENE